MPSVARRRALLAGATVAATTAAMLLGVQGAGAAPAPLDTGVLRTAQLNASVSFPAGQKTGTPAGLQDHEWRQSDPDTGNSENTVRANTLSPTGVPVVAATGVAGAAGLGTSFTGLDSFDQRYANNGNQFSVEPPDQGLCVGNGYVVEAVNTVLRVYRTSGQAASGVTDLNTFYGYPAEFDRATGKQGPFITDPTCTFDAGTGRWFLNVLTLEVDPATGALLGPNHLDVAVSRTGNPLGAFDVYRLPVQDDGTQGTPRHKDCPCIGDYPHIAVDKYGFYVTTNEYPLVSSAPGVYGNNYNGAQIYAFDKTALVNHASRVNVVQFAHTQLRQGGTTVPGFTLAPAQVPGTAYQTANNGTEYFLSSAAGEEAQPGGFTAQSNVLGLYALTNTRSIHYAHPALSLDGSLRPAEQYIVPPRSTQKYGPTPLANFCSVTDCLGIGIQPYSEGGLDSNDSRMGQVYLAHGMLYGALDTGVQVNGRLQAGIAWFVVNPGTSPSAGSVARQGYVGVANQNVTYPAIAALANGSGAMAVTLTGPSWYPTAAYLSVTPTGVTGPVRVAAAGVGPQDGFSEYAPGGATPDSAPRPRWGDYGAAVPVGSSIWLASEFIGQSCSYAAFQQDMTCGGTRAVLTNWATRISTVTP